jgi:hypothetical protein
MSAKNILAALALAVALPAHAVGRLTDATDLWWNAAEPGWGVNVTHQNDILFLTFFVYSASRNPVWYSASEVRYEGTNNGVMVFQGALYETHGPWYADNFYDAASVTYKQVGTVMFRMTSVGTATLVYTADGRTISKELTRFTWRVNEVGGQYLGAVAGNFSSCPSSFDNGYREESVRFVLTQTASNLTIQSTGNNATCTLTGAYRQEGRMGTMSGPYACTNGTAGSFHAFEIEANPQGFTARVETATNNCNFSGRLGGVRRAG